MRRSIALPFLVPLALGACATPMRFAGTLVTEQGACGPGFDAAGKAPATLMLQGGDAQFAPSDGVNVLTGHVSAGGHIVASTNTAGADRKPFPQVFEGDRARDADQVVGRFATPRCRATATLTRR